VLCLPRLTMSARSRMTRPMFRLWTCAKKHSSGGVSSEYSRSRRAAGVKVSIFPSRSRVRMGTWGTSSSWKRFHSFSEKEEVEDEDSMGTNSVVRRMAGKYENRPGRVVQRTVLTSCRKTLATNAPNRERDERQRATPLVPGIRILCTVTGEANVLSKKTGGKGRDDGSDVGRCSTLSYFAAPLRTGANLHPIRAFLSWGRNEFLHCVPFSFASTSS